MKFEHLDLNLNNNPLNNIGDFLERRSRMKIGYDLINNVIEEPLLSNNRPKSYIPKPPLIPMPPPPKNQSEFHEDKNEEEDGSS